MEDFSIPKDSVKMSQPALGPPFHHLTHNLRPSQATVASHPTFPRLPTGHHQGFVQPHKFLKHRKAHSQSAVPSKDFGVLNMKPLIAQLLLWLAGKSLSKNS